MLYKDILEHHGVKGQKWGVRNFRRKRTSAQTRFHRPAHKLTDEELNRRIRRLNMEKQYNDLNKPVASKGKAFTSNLLSSTGQNVVRTIATGAVMLVISKALAKKVGPEAARAITGK